MSNNGNQLNTAVAKLRNNMNVVKSLMAKANAANAAALNAGTPAAAAANLTKAANAGNQINTKAIESTNIAPNAPIAQAQANASLNVAKNNAKTAAQVANQTVNAAAMAPTSTNVGAAGTANMHANAALNAAERGEVTKANNSVKKTATAVGNLK
jgi:hypothetical protein